MGPASIEVFYDRFGAIFFRYTRFNTWGVTSDRSKNIVKTMISGFSRLILGLSLMVFAGTGGAGDLGRPAGKVILTISGDIEHTNAGDRAEFDRTMLEALGMTELTVETAWTDGRPTFSGVLGSRILDAVGARGDEIVARAINDYQVTIPVSDLRRYPILFALKQDGRYMRVRDKGPIWVIYPRESHPELDNEETKQKWIWQLSSIHIQ